jgi:hypothetical protein
MNQELKKKEKELLWELKQVCKDVLHLSIPFERMLKDATYRQDVLTKLKTYQHPSLEPILRQLERMQAQPVKNGSDVEESELLLPVATRPASGYRHVLLIILALTLGFSAAFWWSHSGLSRWLFPASKNQPTLLELPIDKPQVVLEISADSALVPATKTFNSSFWRNSSQVLKEAQRALPPSDEEWQALVAEKGILAINLRLPPQNVPAWRLLEQGVVSTMWSSQDLRLPGVQRLPLGIQGMALIVGRGNGLIAIDYADFKKILSGQTRDWQSLPESKIHGEIRLVTTKETRGTDKNLATPAANVFLLEKDSLAEALAVIASNVQYLGLVPFTPQLTEQLANYPLHLLGLRGQSTGLPTFPSLFSLLSGDYPLRQIVWLYQKQPPSEYGQRYQALLAKNPKFLVDYGYFPVEPLWQYGTSLFSDLTKLPQDYQNVVKNGLRLSITPTAADLADSQSLNIYSRAIVQSLQQNANYKGEVIVVGFSDPQDPQALASARDRAQQLGRQLLSLGVLPGQILAVASLPRSPNPLENQRIEIWIKN